MKIVVCRPTRLDHFPSTSSRPQFSQAPRGRSVGRKRQPHPGSGDTLKVWLEGHGFPISKEKSDNIKTMERATGGGYRH